MKEYIYKHLENKANFEEMKEIVKWINESPFHREEFKRIKSTWVNEKLHEEFDENNTDWKQTIRKIKNNERRNIKHVKYQWIRYAAAVLITVGLTLTGSYFYTKPTPIANQTIVWDNGNISKIILPDSSQVWMNSGSSITYNNDFGISNRNIELRGEAYFEVSKNKSLPFQVLADKITIEVLGTEFSVSNYPEFNNIDVILKEGKVNILESNKNKKHAINPGEMFSFDKSDLTSNIKKVNPRHYIAWIEGYLYFYNEVLESICIKLEKRFDCKLIPDRELANLHFTFAIHNENLNETLKLIESVSNINISKNENIFYFKKSTH